MAPQFELLGFFWICQEINLGEMIVEKEDEEPLKGKARANDIIPDAKGHCNASNLIDTICVKWVLHHGRLGDAVIYDRGSRGFVDGDARDSSHVHRAPSLDGTPRTNYRACPRPVF